MVNQTEKNSVCFAAAQTANGRLNRGELALFPFPVDDHRGAIEFQFVADVFRVRAEHHAGQADFRMAGRFEKVLQERAPLIIEQRFGRSHATRFAGGEDYGSEHFSLPYPAPAGPAFASSTFLCGTFAALRRTAISSAVMLMAISSGVSAPMSNPTGACTRSKFSSAMPSFSSALYTERTFRLLPIMPT